MDFAVFRPFAIFGLSVAGALLLSAAASAETASHCARYGSDYVAVAGSDGCVRIGGHVRVDNARAPAVAAGAMGYAALPDGVQRTAARGGYYPAAAPLGLGDLFPR
jgi:type IV secretory pathway protease TraF